MHLLQFFLSAPSRLMSGVVRMLGTPFRMLSSTRGITGQLTRIPRTFSRLGIHLPKARTESVRLWFEGLRPQRVNRRKRISETAQFSQIHLIQIPSNKRTVLHVGATIGRKKADLALKLPDGRTTTLQFTLGDPGELDCPVELTWTPASAKVQVNDAPTASGIFLKGHDIIGIGGQCYVYELYAWDRSPVVTRVDAGWATTRGTVRERNEDAVGVYQHPKGYLFAIADGVGNGQDGDLISAFSVQYLLAVFARNIPYDLSWREVLGTGYQYINSEVRYFAQTALLPTGSTLTALVIRNWEATVAHVGDSRLYRFRNGILDQLTADHVNRLPVELPTRVAAEANDAPPLHDVLTRAIGKSDSIQPDFLTVALQPGDRFLLVTDGIGKCLTLGDLSEVLATNSPTHAAERLIELANERKADDNASAVVVEVLGEAYVDDAWRAVSKERVFAGDRRWSLHLERHEDPGTIVPLFSSGCLLAVAAIVIIALILWAIFGLGANNAHAASMNAVSTHASLTALLQTGIPAL